MLTHPWLNLDPKINDVNEKPEVSEEDRENAIVILKEIVKQHL